MKTTELRGESLDWAVAKCEGLHREDTEWWIWASTHRYSSDWEIGGEILEREGYHVGRIHTLNHDRKQWGEFYWIANGVRGATLLEAVMRCHVKRCLGDEVDIPRELLDK